MYSVQDNRINAAGLSHSETSGSNGYVRLTGAYRSLSRPSSPMNAKASPVCPCVLQKIRKSDKKNLNQIRFFAYLNRDENAFAFLSPTSCLQHKESKTSFRAVFKEFPLARKLQK